MRQTQLDRVATNGQTVSKSEDTQPAIKVDEEDGQRIFSCERFERPLSDHDVQSSDQSNKSNKGLYAIIIVMSLVIVLLVSVIVWQTGIQNGEGV
ncbi:MAG: hypothetical protein RR619_09485, partial [Raoultibacter sp.]